MIRRAVDETCNQLKKQIITADHVIKKHSPLFMDYSVDLPLFDAIKKNH